MARFKNATEFATNQIKGWILSGDLKPNEKVDQDELATRLALSRLPVRQALERLSEQGFVEVRPHRGAVVSPLSARDMKDLYAIRAKLEDWALAEAWPHYTADFVGELRDLVSEADQAVAEENLNRYMSVNRQFHLGLFAPASNSYLQRVIMTYYDLSERYQRTSLCLPSRLEQSNQDHWKMIEAIQNKDRKAFLELARQHNKNTAASVLNSLSLSS